MVFAIEDMYVFYWLAFFGFLIFGFIAFTKVLSSKDDTINIHEILIVNFSILMALAFFTEFLGGLMGLRKNFHSLSIPGVVLNNIYIYMPELLFLFFSSLLIYYFQKRYMGGVLVKRKTTSVTGYLLILIRLAAVIIAFFAFRYYFYYELKVPLLFYVFIFLVAFFYRPAGLLYLKFRKAVKETDNPLLQEMFDDALKEAGCEGMKVWVIEEENEYKPDFITRPFISFGGLYVNKALTDFLDRDELRPMINRELFALKSNHLIVKWIIFAVSLWLLMYMDTQSTAYSVWPFYNSVYIFSFLVARIFLYLDTQLEIKAARYSGVESYLKILGRLAEFHRENFKIVLSKFYRYPCYEINLSYLIKKLQKEAPQKLVPEAE